MPGRQLFNTIVWASDGRADEHEHQVFRYVHELCDRYCCELWIVHIVPTTLPEPVAQRELHGRQERTIAGLKARTRALRRQGVSASLHVVRGVVGSPATAIAQVAAAVDADLIVLRAHASHSISPIDTAARLLARSRCPLLLFRGEAGVVGSRYALASPAFSSPTRSLLGRRSSSPMTM